MTKWRRGAIAVAGLSWMFYLSNVFAEPDKELINNLRKQSEICAEYAKATYMVAAARDNGAPLESFIAPLANREEGLLVGDLSLIDMYLSGPG